LANKVEALGIGATFVSNAEFHWWRSPRPAL